MRLIDADKIEFVLPRTLTEEEKNTYNLVIGKAFDNAPTVKAIPIEWLCRKYLDISKKSWSAVMCLIVNKIIRAWVKENEQAN